MLCAVGAGVMVGSVLPQGGDFPSVLSHSQASLCQKITALLGLGSVPVLQGRTLNQKRKRCWWGGLKKEQSPHSGHCGGMRVVATECSQIWAPIGGARWVVGVFSLFLVLVYAV